MQQLNENHTFTGMQKDLAISRHPSTFLYDAHNIRLTARGKDTLLSITNERGPLKTGITIEGTYLGHCLLRNYLTVFSTTTPVQQESITSTASGSSRLYINHINRWQDSFQTDTPSTDTSQESTSESTSGDETTTPTVLPDNILPWQPVVTENSTSNIVSNNSSTTEENSEENDEETNEEESTSSEEESSSEQTSTITSPDYITRIDLSTGEVVVLYNGNLRFSPLYPIETIGSYENESIQKIYWTDGLNQPRLINIVGEIKDDLDTQFDFIRELQLNETISIKKELGAAGMFPPGVIQYAFTYYTKYGQESNIFYTSPLMYTSYQDRGASPEDKVENAFRINITNLDTNFDYLRIYSIQRTSINGTPIVKRVQDIYTKAEAAEPDDRGVVESSTLPSVLINGVYKQPDPFNAECSYYKRVYIDWGDVTTGNPIFWYGFKRSDYPDLRIKTEYGYVTFDDNPSPSDDNIIWYSTQSYTKNGVRKYRVYQTNGYNDSDIYSTGDIRSVSFYDANTPLEGVSFLDTGTTGDSVDPTELLYKGGESLIVGTLAQKDSTLFFGNIQLNVPPIISDLKTQIEELSVEQDTRKFYPIKNFSDNYVYANQLNSYNGPVDSAENPISVPCGGFKRGDYYRCGIQFQYKDGKWSDPIFIDDTQVTNKPSFRVLSTVEDLIPAGTAEVTVPTLKVTIPSTDNVNTIAKTLISRGYKKARAVVVMPQLQDRVTICQGVLNPTMYTNNNRNSKKLFQSSWFFRPTLKGMAEPSDGTANPKATGTLHYTNNSVDSGYYPNYDPIYIRKVEIEGNFAEDDKFNILSSPLGGTIISTLHSPDIEFDDSLSLLDYIDVSWREVGISSVVTTFSDIDIQTESPTIGNNGAGFLNKGFIKTGTAGLISGLFYEDYVVDDNNSVASKFEAWRDEHSPVKWLIYPWHRTGSLNNDIKRPADSGARTAVLKKKVLSNLRYADTIFKETVDEGGYSVSHLDTDPKVYNLDQIGIVKLGEIVYQGNIDTLLLPDKTDGNYFAFGNNDTASSGNSLAEYNTTTGFNSIRWWKTFGPDNNNLSVNGLYKWNSSLSKWTVPSGHEDIGDVYNELVLQKEQVRMKYKSSPHLVAAIASEVPDGSIPNNTAALRIVEIIRNGAGNASGTPKPHYRSTMFGGTSEDALKANIWIPCGEPVALNDTEDVVVQYSYGDTYYQRWDCLKTYPFTKEDINQIVEIGSFMLETRVNIDGRYDRNRGQVSNINMSPVNFNLMNPIYSQLNNFFTYRILDDDFYEINKFPNQITWSKEKQAGADIDLWTNVTLGSTYDMDGSKGSITALRVWKDNIYCFQDKGISNILFNSRVQIPVSDGVPIEITNSYKVEGYRYLSDGTGCTNKWTIKPTPSGIYFVNATDNHLYHIGEGLQDLTTVRNMTSWFNNVANNEIISTLYDDVNKDVYLLTNTEALCYSELLGQFVSFMSYDGIYLIESNGNYIYTMRKIEPDNQGVQDNKDELYYMFNGTYNNFFGEQKGWDFTFISNGVDNQLMDFDKTYSTIDYRMDIFGYTLDNSNNTVETYEANKSFDYIRAFNEYQDSDIIPLSRLRRRPAVKNIPSPKYDYVGANMQKKFRIWRLQIPRNKNSLDRIRNTWCKIQLGNNGTENTRAVFYDLNVQYFI